jgi:hypothetical protein
MISSHARYQAMRPRQRFGVQPVGYEHDGSDTHKRILNMVSVVVKSSLSVAVSLPLWLSGIAPHW